MEVMITITMDTVTIITDMIIAMGSKIRKKLRFNRKKKLKYSRKLKRKLKRKYLNSKRSQLKWKLKRLNSSNKQLKKLRQSRSMKIIIMTMNTIIIMTMNTIIIINTRKRKRHIGMLGQFQMMFFRRLEI
jgi:hypothetical protein